MKGERRAILVAVEDEPYPRGPTGESCRLKLRDWLQLAAQRQPQVPLEICPLTELEGRQPDIVEMFSIREAILTAKTFPARREHEVVNRFSSYWPAVERAGVPIIPVIHG